MSEDGEWKQNAPVFVLLR